MIHLIIGLLWLGIAPWGGVWSALGASEPAAVAVGELIDAQGVVEWSRGVGFPFERANPSQKLYEGDSVRTGERSRARLRIGAATVVEMGEAGSFTVPSQTKPSGVRLRLMRGLMYFFNRGTPGEFEVETPGASAVVRGTEFTVEIDDTGASTLRLIEGEVEVSNDAGRIDLRSGDGARVVPGQAPVPLPALQRDDPGAIQWFLYYPAIVEPGDLGLDPTSAQASGGVQAAAALEAYLAGDLRGAAAAVADLPKGAPSRWQVFAAALDLAVGRVESAESSLVRLAGDPDEQAARCARALVAQISAVRGNVDRSGFRPELEQGARLTTEFLALSYVRQAQRDLTGALEAAREAVRRTPGSGWARVRTAELEFGFGRIRQAESELGAAGDRAARNAQAAALRGFLRAAANDVDGAERHFERAIELDGGLANGWLGRGLIRIRRGRESDGLWDLQTAAAAEPQRAILRSYLAKALDVAGRPAKSRLELRLAREMDPLDPTVWLYSALLKQQGNSINPALRDLAEANRLGDQRGVYRSTVLLDEDRAVRGANLASVYRDLGLVDLAVLESSRAVDRHYASPGAHVFLADAYNALRDPRQVDLRYETPWLSEYLLGNLLLPAGGGLLSQTLSQNEYGRLFDRDEFGLSSETRYSSGGDWMQWAAQHGRFGSTAYSVDVVHRSESGQRPNSDFEQTSVTASWKQQVTLEDSVFVQVTRYDAAAGDVAPRYGWSSADPGLRVVERHEPLGAIGWHRQWAPESHTLVLASPWHSTMEVFAPGARSVFFERDGSGQASLFDPAAAVPWLNYRSVFSGASAEVQQINRIGDHTLVAGGRYQGGAFDLDSVVDVSGLLDPTYGAAGSRAQQVHPQLSRYALYAFDFWNPWESLWLTVGLSYEQIRQPVNFRSPPTSAAGRTDALLSPKVGLRWAPWKSGALRGMWTRALTGPSFDQSYRLEPVQLAGFTQSYRGLLPEALTGAAGGQRLEMVGLGLEQRLGTNVFLWASAERLESRVTRAVGAYEWNPTGAGRLLESGLDQSLVFVERSLSAGAGYLAGRDWAFRARYRLSEDKLGTQFPDVPALFDGARSQQHSVLHQAQLGVRFNHPLGWFGDWESNWTSQSNQGDAAGLAGENVWQHNVRVGYRFAQRRAEVSLAVLNLTDQDYLLHPLNHFLETYRRRTIEAGLKWSF